MILVSVVIVSWNVKKLLVDCIQGIVDCNDFEIIVIDNYSTDGTVETLKIKFPTVRVIENRYNYGFANANNQGFEISTGKYIYILNPDTLCSIASIRVLIEDLERCKDVGIIGPKILLGDGTIQNSCARRLPSIWSFFISEVIPSGRILGFCKVSNINYPYSYNERIEVEAISGAAMLIRTDLVRRYGGFSNLFIHTGEDLELNYRIRKLGYRIIYNPASEIIHFSGQSSKQAELRITVNSYISYQKYFELTKGKFSAILFKYLLLLIKVPSTYIYYYLMYICGKIDNRDWSAKKILFMRLYYWKQILR